MTNRIIPKVVRSASALWILACAAPHSPAQGLDNRDPFVIMRGDAGNQMQPADARDWRLNPNPYEQPSEAAYERARSFDLTQHVIVPAAPSILGEPPPAAAGPGFGSSQAPAFAREIFYGCYVVASHLGKLTPRQAARIAAFREDRDRLVAEIRAKLDELATTTPAARQAGLVDLATRQDARLRALAEEAEAIRSDLAWVKSVFRIKTSLPGGPFRAEQPADGEQVEVVNSSLTPASATDLPRMFSAAYFHAGLSTEQRLLLTEIGYGATPGAASFAFLPPTARVPLPANLPAPLGEKLRAFTELKESLKSELRVAVLRDDYFLTSTRTRRLADLAAQQAPRFAALEALADEIRPGLAALAAPDSPANLLLPAALVQRIGQFNARKVDARRELLGRLRRLRTENLSSTFDIIRQGDGLAIVAGGNPARAVPGLAEFNASQARLYTELAAESEVLRRDVARYLESSPQRGSRTVDQLAGDFARAYAVRAHRDFQRDYTRAVLEPGLSTAQRLLLFHAALAGLDQTATPAQP